ncbi:GNAT family N-acetyltransferase [Sphingobium sp.]|uniref:GNAT family N-acetyltransferase n=1 Tax=Sphingobium sp. TaxID=1912891 RepID=UPI000DB009CD|nr:GNAT family N-acetyltransferase [Sphingobium sp.]PZU69343.1 MAG: GNAT family N-acetyltransferase [Sphingobium sp.]
MNDATNISGGGGHAAGRGGADLVTRSGFRFCVRPVTDQDEPALAEFFRQVTPDDLRFRFLAAVHEVSHFRLVEMIHVDKERTESFLVTPYDDPDVVIAAAMLAADLSGERAEVAISIRADHKGRGIGWTLLDHLARHAKAKGIRVLEAIESRQNRSAITLEREMGFAAEAIEGDPNVVLLRRQLA